MKSNIIKETFSDKKFLKQLIAIILPLAFQELMLACVAAADAFMLGGIDQNSMSAVSLATQLQFIQNMAIYGTLSGFSILSAQYWGTKAVKTIKKLLAIVISICVAVSILTFLGCFIIPEQLMKIYTDDPTLISIGCDYLRVASWSYLITGIIECYLSLMKVTDHAVTTSFISSGTVILNIILNAIFIFGLFGIKPMGAVGAALATLISRIIELIFCIGMSSRIDYIRPEFKYFFSFDKELFKSFIKTSIPVFGAYMVWGIGFSTYTSCIGHIGPDASAANAVVAVIRDLLCCVCNGLAIGGGIKVGNELGAGNLVDGKRHGRSIAVLSFLYGFICTAIVWILIPILSNILVLTENAKTVYFSFMAVLSVYIIGRCVNTVIINGVFSAGGDTIFDLISTGISMWLIAIPLAFLGTYVFNWPPILVYMCTCIDEVGKIPIVIYHFKKYKWVKDLTIEGKKG